MSRVVVIGAGVGGLAAAARLAPAATGSPSASGPASSAASWAVYEPRTAFRFDTGPSLLTLPQVFADLFAAPATCRLLVALDPLVRHASRTARVLDSVVRPGGLRATGSTPRSGAGAADDWRRLWRRAERIWDASGGPSCSRRSAARPTWPAWPGGSATCARSRPGGRCAGWAGATCATRGCACCFERYATYTGSDPRRAPAALAAVPYVERRFGGWYLRGGLGTLGRRAGRRAPRSAARIRTGTEVDRGSSRRAGGPAGCGSADGGTVPADVVVANADAAHVYRDLLPQPAPRGRLRRAASCRVRPAARRPRPEPRTWPTTTCSSRATTTPSSTRSSARPGAGPPGRRPDDLRQRADDPAVQPDGHEAWFVLVNAPRHGTGPGAVDWGRPALAGAYADRLLGLLARRGLDVRDRLCSAVTRTPADLAAATRAPGGAIYGTARRPVGLRPPNRGPVRGLFLVGGSAHPGGGLPLVTLSARIVATQIGPA